MVGQIGDMLMQMLGKPDPREALVQAIAGQAGTPSTPQAVGDTQGGVGTGAGTGAPPQPAVYQSPPQLVQLYSDLLKRDEINQSLNRGIGLIGASLAHPENRNAILRAYGDSGAEDAGGLVNNLLALRANQTAAATKAAQRASVPAIAKQLGIDDQTALYLFDSGKLDQVVAEAQKPDNQIIQDAATGQSHIVNKKTGEIGPALGGAKPRDTEIVTDGNTGQKTLIYKDTGKPVTEDPLVKGTRKTEYIEEPLTGTKRLVYSDTKEPVPDAAALPGGGNTELQKNWNAAMRGLTPGDPGYMSLTEFEKAQKNSNGQRFLQVGNGKVFDTQEQKFVADPADPASAIDTSPDNAPVLAPGQVDADYLSKLPADTQSLVKGLTDYTLDLSKVSSIRGDARQKLAAMAKRYDPSFDMSQFPARAAMRKSMTSGNYSQAINSSNLVIQHLHKLSEIAKTMDNGNYPLLNWGKNIASQQTGDDEITNFKTTAEAAAAELAKVFKGTGTSSLTEIEDWKKNLDPNASPKQIQTSIKTLVVDLLGSRLDTIRQQYSSAMGKPADFSILTDKSKKILSDLGIDPTDLGEKPPEDKPAADNAPAGEPSIDDLVKKYGKKQ